MLFGCSLIEKTEDFIMPKKGQTEKLLTEKKTVTISCERGDIKEYLEKGWKIIDTETKEIPCSWKTTKATKRCNIDRDKGCRITIPDKMGNQLRYILEKTSKVDTVIKKEEKIE